MVSKVTIIDPLILHQPVVNKKTTLKQVSSHSTVGSDDTSSRVYESALESLHGDDEGKDTEKENENKLLPSNNLSPMDMYADFTPQSPYVSRKPVPVKPSTSTSSGFITIAVLNILADTSFNPKRSIFGSLTLSKDKF